MSRSRRARRGEPSPLAGLKRLVLPGLLGVAAYYALFGGDYSVFEVRDARASVLIEQARLDEARMEIDSLRTLSTLLQEDSASIERIARESFGMIRRGETLYRIADPADVTPTPSTPER